MKIIIFLAGIGSRFKAVTNDPKCLIKIGDKPFIFHYLDALNDLGIKKVIFVVGYKKEKIKEAVGSSYKELKIKYIENKDYIKDSILSLLYTKDEFDDDVITMDGDVIFDKALLAKLMDFKKGNCFLVEPHYSSKVGDKYMIVTDKKGIVRTTGYNYRLKEQEGDIFWEEVGFIKWSKENSHIFKKAFDELLNQGIDNEVYEKAINYLIENKLCQFKVISAEGFFWDDLDNPQDLEKVEQLCLKLKDEEDPLFNPIKTKKVESKYRKIVSDYLPGPKSIELIKKLKVFEPSGSIGQLPLGIAEANGVKIKDLDGNVFLDGTSGMNVTNVGHAPECINDAIREQLEKFHHVYCFPFEKRTELTKRLVEVSPENIDQALLFTTGSETTEASIKLTRGYNKKKYGPEKSIIISFKGAFHGKTMGAQMAGGIDELKEWIGHQDPGLIQIEFPYCYRCWKGRKQYENCTDDCLNLLRQKFKENPGKIAAVMCETFQGRNMLFPPKDFFQGIEKICKENNALFILDEIQAGAGRLGKLFGFEYYGVKPNLICLGKGISGGLPLSILLGESEIFDSFGKGGELTTTHSTDPICVVATLTALNKLLENDKEVIKNCAKNGEIFRVKLNELKEKYSCIGDVRGKGMIWGLDIVKDRETKEPDPKLATRINLNIYKRGVLLKIPRGLNKNIINITPPLIASEEIIQEMLCVVEEAFEEVFNK